MTTEQKSENLKTLLSMFPEVDSEICEAVLETNNSDLEASVNTLLGMTDPNYKPPPEEELMTSANTQTTGQQQLRTPLSTTRTTTTPSLPPRSSPLDPNATVIESRVFVTKEEQIRRDEELARRLAAEDQIEYVEQHRATQQQRRRQRQEEEDQSSFPDFSEELPVIKEKIVQAADTTKKKVKEWYDKLKQQSVALRNEYVSGHDNNNDRNQNQSQHHYSNLPYDEFDNTLLDEDFTKSLDNSSNHHQNLNNFTGVSKDVKDSDNDNKIYSNSSGSNSGNKINNNNLRSSPLRSQQPVYGSYEIDLNNKKDSYSPFDNDRKGNDLITATSSSSSSAIINNNIKSDNGTSSISKKNQQKSTSEFLPYSISVDNDDKNSEKEKKEKVKEEETDDKSLDKVFHEKLNITTKPTFSSITSSSSSSSSSNNVITNTNNSKRENNGNIPLLDEDTKKE